MSATLVGSRRRGAARCARRHPPALIKKKNRLIDDLRHRPEVSVLSCVGCTANATSPTAMNETFVRSPPAFINSMAVERPLPFHRGSSIFHTPPDRLSLQWHLSVSRANCLFRSVDNPPRVRSLPGLGDNLQSKSIYALIGSMPTLYIRDPARQLTVYRLDHLIIRLIRRSIDTAMHLCYASAVCINIEGGLASEIRPLQPWTISSRCYLSV